MKEEEAKKIKCGGYACYTARNYGEPDYCVGSYCLFWKEGDCSGGYLGKQRKTSPMEHLTTK